MKKVGTFFLLLLHFTIYSQDVDLRDLTLKSDVVILVELHDFAFSTRWISDYFTERYLTIKSCQKVLKNKSAIKFANKEIYCPEEGNDFYYNTKVNGGDCTGIGEALEVGKKYYSILFLKKEKKKLVLLTYIWRSNTDWDYLSAKINDVKIIEDAKLPDEVYEKSLDYYLKYDSYPSSDFVDYYRHIKILETDTLKLNSKQLLVVREKFKAGNERYYDLIKNKYPKEVTKYYLEKMEKLSTKENVDDISFYDFEEAYERATQTDYNDSSELGKLKDQLTDYQLSFEEKQEIMKKLIENVYKENRL